MFAFGCEKPASLTKSWNCGNVVCQGEKTILFAWGRNAPALQLPDGKLERLVNELKFFIFKHILQM